QADPPATRRVEPEQRRYSQSVSALAVSEPVLTETDFECCISMRERRGTCTEALVRRRDDARAQHGFHRQGVRSGRSAVKTRGFVEHAGGHVTRPDVEDTEQRALLKWRDPDERFDLELACQASGGPNCLGLRRLR